MQKVEREERSRSSGCKIALFKYKSSTRRALRSSGCKIAICKFKSIVREAHSRSSGSKFATSRYKSSLRRIFPQLRLKKFARFSYKSSTRRAPRAVLQNRNFKYKSNTGSALPPLQLEIWKNRNFSAQKWCTKYAPAAPARNWHFFWCKSPTRSAPGAPAAKLQLCMSVRSAFPWHEARNS